jgi:hypothetical protein
LQTSSRLFSYGTGVAMILFGIRSPIAVEYEETCRRLGLEIAAAVSVSGTPRIMDRSRIVDLADFDASAADGEVFLACAFTPRRRMSLIAQAKGLGLLLAAALVDPHAVLAL